MITHHKLLDQNLIKTSDGYVKVNRFSSMLRPGKIINIKLDESVEHFHTIVRYYTQKQMIFMLESYYSSYMIKRHINNNNVHDLSEVRISLNIFNDDIVDFIIYRKMK